MGTYCTIKPHIKTEDGKFEESRLYNDLLSLTSRDRAKTNRAYSVLISEDFKEKYSDIINLDSLKEPVLSNLLNVPEIKDIIDKETTIAGLTRSLGGINKEGTVYHKNTINNYLDLSRKVTEFNTSSSYKDNYVALVKKNENGLFISVETPNEENGSIAGKIATNLNLYERIVNILSASGISVNIINDLQERLKANGVVDYETATTTAEGIINLVKLAEGKEGVEALPEEFAHLAFDVMENNSLKDRLLAILDNEEVISKILGDSYDSYKELYGEYSDRLKREAAGKLIYQSWFNNSNPIPEYKSFIGRLLSYIKNIVRKVFNRQDINDAIVEAEKLSTEIGTRILSSESLEDFQLRELKKLPSLYSVSQSAKTKKELLRKSIDNSLKKYLFYVEKLKGRIRTADSEDKKTDLQEKLDAYKESMKNFIDKQQEAFDRELYDEGLQNFIENSIKELENVKKRFNSILGEGMSLQEKAYNLINISNILNSIEKVAKDTQTSLNYDDTDIEFSQGTREDVDTLVAAIDGLKGQYNVEAFKVFGTFLNQFFPKEGVEVTRDGKRVKLTQNDILDLLKTAEQDIGAIDTFLQSASNSNDIILRLADKAMKASKDRKRQRVEEVKNSMLQAAKELKDSGSSDEFMFERHADGSLSSRYRSDINWTAYFDNKEAFIKKLKEKYGARPKGQKGKKYLAELNAWKRENETVIGIPNAKYQVDKYEGLTEAQKKYYDTFMEIRSNMISLLPIGILDNDPMRAVQITKELFDRLKDTNVSEWGSQLKKAMKDSLIIKVDDTNFGFKKAVKGFNDEELMSVPIFFIKKLDNEKDLSRDTASTLMTFADMAINYSEMSEVSDLFEVGRTVMENRDSEVRSGNKPLAETIKGLGITVTQNIRKSSNNNFVARYNELLRTQLYGRYFKEETIPIKDGEEKISAPKAANLLNRISSLNQLAINLLAGIAAVGSDIINVNSEVLASAVKDGKSFFTAKNLWDADKIYRKDIIKVLGEFGNPIKTSKLGLFIEKFNVLHDYESKIMNLEVKKSKARKILSENSLYFMMQAGAHWGETRTALAQAQNIMITSNDGTTQASLWDILDVEYNDPNDHSKGARLVTKEGYTLTSEDITKYTRMFEGLNQRLFGIYSKGDVNTLQTTAIGQLIFLYRKFIIPSINRRYAGLFSGNSNYNFDLDQETEGYYTSAFRFIKNLITDSRDFGRNIAMYWNDMEDFQRSNCMRALNEVLTFVILSSLSGILKGADWDKKDNPWAERFVAYMSRRLKTETGAFSPFGITGELWNILKSPMAAVDTIEGAADILQALWLPNWIGEDALIERGRYKGMPKGYKAIMESPFVPMNKTVYRALHPESTIMAFN